MIAIGKCQSNGKGPVLDFIIDMESVAMITQPKGTRRYTILFKSGRTAMIECTEEVVSMVPDMKKVKL